MLKKFVSYSTSILCLLMLTISLFSVQNIEAKNKKNNKNKEEIVQKEQDSVNTADVSDVFSESISLEKKSSRLREPIELNSNFFISLGLDIAMMILLISVIYYPNYKKFDTIFTFVVFNISIFLLTFLLNKIKISMGAAFGLFAVFSMLRYRTTGISVKDMTYLFIFITIGLISGIQLDITDLSIVMGIVFVACLLFDTKLLFKRESTKMVIFENIDLITPDKRTELIEELKKRTGLNIHRVSIEEISYLKDCADIVVYYYE